MTREKLARDPAGLPLENLFCMKLAQLAGSAGPACADGTALNALAEQRDRDAVEHRRLSRPAIAKFYKDSSKVCNVRHVIPLFQLVLFNEYDCDAGSPRHRGMARAPMSPVVKYRKNWLMRTQVLNHVLRFHRY